MGEYTIARLILELGKVRGRKHLQKIVHLLKAKGAKDFRQRFILYYFGPFSRKVASQLDLLCDLGLVDESKDGETYVYSVRDDKSARAEILEFSGTGKKQPEWAALANELNKHDTPFLEALSTIVFLDRPDWKDGDLKKEFTHVKPRLSDLFDECLKYAKREKFMVDWSTQRAVRAIAKRQ